MSKSCWPEFTPGRGAPSNRTSWRFGLAERERDGDWLDQSVLIDEPVQLKTHVTIEKPKSIITRNASPDLPFDRSINPYRGCEHGCVYCYARPTHAWHDLSPGLDFESRLFAKRNAADLLRSELSKKGYRAAPIALGTNTDPYQPIERQFGLTRACLQILAETSHPLTITTKSDRVVRDIDILSAMASKGLVAVAISITSLDDRIHRSLEPRAPRPQKRLAALRALAKAGIPVHISIAPVIPAITDHEIEVLVAAGAEAGAQTASYIPIRLPHEVAPLFRDWLAVHYRDRAEKVMAQIRQMRGGRDNDPDYFARMRGAGPWADLIRVRFRKACRAAGLNTERTILCCDLFNPPEGAQLRLF